MKKTAIKLLLLMVLSTLLLGVPKLSGLIASLFSYESVDPDGAFMWISVHHIVQALIFLLLMLFLINSRSLDFKLGWGDRRKGISYLIKFSIIFGLGSIISHIIVISQGSLQPLHFPMNARNITGYLGFQLLLSGPSEELIFRAFAITMFGLILPKRIFKDKISTANILAALIFALAHVGIQFDPFSLSYHPYQLLMSGVLGLFYGDCYEKTDSVIYPMAMHSISNVIMVGLTAISSAFIL